MEDPDARVAGRGIAYLTERGIDVTVGVGAEAARALNAPYVHHRTTGRPFVTLKLALSLDGRMAAPDGSARWITGEAARRRVHARRLECDAVLVGAGTVLADDPSLTVRDVAAARQPARVVVDARGRIPATSRFFGPGETIVFTTIACPHPAKTGWKEAGAEVLLVSQDATGEVDLHAVLDNLGGRGWVEVYCEGGARLGTSVIEAGLVDRLELYYGPVLLGGSSVGLGDLGVTAIDRAARWKTTIVERVGDDVLVVLDKAEG
jgi:diaminohydroxyphosphoribosylaminopyrimidine deaminase/5-amino-6-(5-phosphoribosylamino)uracil reductase